MKNEKIDARKIDTKAQQEKRNIAMKLREKGMKNLESSRYSWSTPLYNISMVFKI